MQIVGGRRSAQTKLESVFNMKTKNLVGIGVSMLLFGACIPSVQPFYTEKDVVYDARLVGEWQSKDESDRETWKFEKSDEKGYKLVVVDKGGKKGEMNARLFKLKDELFLDLIPKDYEFAPDQAEIVAAAMFPGHLLMHVSQIEPSLRLALCDFDWLAKFLEEHPDALAFQKEDKRVLLTAQTKDLQAFVTKHLEELFDKQSEFERKAAK